MEIQSGKSYISRGGQIFGPLEVEPKALENAAVWVWRTRHDGDWMHWTHSGKWYQDPTKESANDLVREAEADADTYEEWRRPEAISARIKSYNDEPNAIKDKLAEKIAGPMTKHRLLDLAKEATADRGLNYGKPEDNFARIAAHWNAFLANRFGVNSEGKTYVTVVLSPTDVAIMMAGMKLARLEHQPDHMDSWVDLAGYAACGAEIALSTDAGTTTTKKEPV